MNPRPINELRGRERAVFLARLFGKILPGRKADGTPVPTKRKKPVLPPTPEAVIQARIVTYLKARGIVFTVSDASRTFGKDGRPRPSKCCKGWPDICGVLPNSRFFCIEVKSSKGKLRPEQSRVLRRIYDSGGLVIVARSVEEVMRTLKREV